MTKIGFLQKTACFAALSLLFTFGFGFAQDTTQSPPPSPPAPPQAQDQAQQPQPGWRRFSTPPPGPQTAPSNPSNPADPSGPPAPAGQDYGQNQAPPPPQEAPPPQQAPPPIPPQLTLRSGTYVTVRVNQFLSSDRNQAGDIFTGTLAEPLVVDGVVVAEPGENITGRVVEAQKAGRVKGVSHLGLELTSLTLVDGEQLPIHSQLTSRKGPTSEGRDAAAIGVTTGTGAAIGAAAGGPWHPGEGAAIGAGAGVVASTIGVLLTRGRPTVVYPESLLAFQTVAPATFSTAQAPQAFHEVEPGDYQQSAGPPGPPGPRPGGPPANGYGYPPPPPPYGYGYPYAYGYPYYGYPYGYPYWGPGFAFYYGPGFYGRGFYRGGFFFGRGFFPGRGFYNGRGFVGRGFGPSFRR